MAFKLLYQTRALADLEEIFEWSRDHHPRATERFGNDLFNYLDRLKAFPYMGAVIKSGSRPWRRLVYPPLLIDYRIDEQREAIRILRIQHAARSRK